MGIKNKIGLWFFTIFLLIVIYLSWFSGVIWTIISLTIYGLIAYVVVFLWKKIRKKPMLVTKTFALNFLSGIGFSVLLISIILGWFTYYTNEISPAKMPTYYLSNGEKELIFQWMSHIGTKNFYNNVIENIREAKQDGFVLYYEWVRPWTEENNENFNKAIWIEFDEDLYKNFSKLYGVVNQNNDDLLRIENNEDYNVDLSIDTIMEIYEEKHSASKKVNREVIDASAEITNVLAELNEKQLRILVYINQAILNTIISSPNLRDNILKISGNSDIFDVILNDRNIFLVDEIVNSSDDKIITTYGLMHFEWVLELLQEKDPNWKVTDEKHLYPIQ